MEVTFGWTVPVFLGPGKPAVLVGVGVELSREVAVNVGLGVGEDVTERYSVGVAVSDGVCWAVGVRVFL